MTALVFPGQGSQYINMSHDFHDNFSVVKETFELIEDTTKIKIREIIFKNHLNLLNQTQFTQLAIFASSISIFKVLSSEIDIGSLKISCMLGHSLGEYSALTASGIISIENCSSLLKIRGELMQNAYEPKKSGMAAIIGIDCKKVQDIINNYNLKIEIANDNSPKQIVISGIMESVIESEKYFKENGAKKFVILNVSAAFHSHLMKSAEDEMIQYIDEIKFKNPTIPIISNFTANSSIDLPLIIQNLKNQMSNRVRWVESIQRLESIKENNIIEIGPGKVLSGLIKRISNNFDINSIDVISDLEKINNAI